MGGRGGNGRGKISAGSPDGVFESNKTTTIETTFRDRRGKGLYSSGFSYDDEVLEATTDGKGNVKFSYARGGTYEKVAKTNVKGKATFELKAGAVNGETFNINWSKVNSISGQTYSLRSKAKQEGLKWDSSSKSWKRP